MGRIGLTTSKSEESAGLSEHFGMAKWVLVYDEGADAVEAVRNRGLTGSAVAELMAARGCTDAVFTSIGEGALRHLREAGIRGWYGPRGEPAAGLAARLGAGQLRPADEADHKAPQRHRGRS